ncbi:MAG: T9SS type A sorting domain-containing protein, partial [Bacteroidota bacterium]
INAVTASVSTSRNITGLAPSTLYDWRVRTNCTNGLTSNDAQAQFTTAAVSPACPGSYDLGNNGTTATAVDIPFNIDIKGLIEARGDEDYYKFTITTAGPITISLTTLPADYQLSLLNSSGIVQQSSTNNGTVSETINVTTISAGIYYVRVYPKNNGAFNASNCYTLRVQTSGSTLRDASGTDMITLSNRLAVFPNPARNTANLIFNTESGGSATISVINQTGSIVLNKILAVNSGDNIKPLDISHLANGMYFIKIQTGSVIQMAKLVIGK